MLGRLEVYHILFEMKSAGVAGTEEHLKLLTKSADVPRIVINFINENRNLRITEFYEELRRKNNTKSSKLYKCLMTDETEPQEILKTASSYITQVLIKAEHIELSERDVFYRNSKVKLLSAALSKYFSVGEIKEVVSVLQSIKQDIKILENKEKY